MTPLEEFDKAIADITQRRGTVYAHPADNFRRIMAMWAVINECPDELVRHALCMIAVKISRLIQTPDQIDAFVDISGYSRTGVMILDRRAQEKAQSATEASGATSVAGAADASQQGS